MKVLLITTSSNAVRNVLEQLVGTELQIIDCEVHGVDVLKILEKQFSDVVPDLIITYRCPFIIPKRIFGQARMGGVNIHPSLLPKYSGLNPWKDIFLNHEREGGVTLHQMTEHVDSGPIIYQSIFSIDDSDTIDSARIKADRIAAKLVKMLIKKYG